MWRKLLSMMRQATMVQKIVMAVAMVAVIGTVAAVSVNLTSDDEPVNSQQDPQLEDQFAEVPDDEPEFPEADDSDPIPDSEDSGASEDVEDSKDSEEDSEEAPDSEENQEVAHSSGQKKPSSGNSTNLNTDNKEQKPQGNTNQQGGSGSQKPATNNYQVTFLTNGGTDLAQQSVVAGTKISSLPTPYKEGAIFLGWYYDAEGKQPVGSEDVISKSMSLYAGYAKQAELEAIEQKTFVGAEDVATDFSIKVVTEDKTLDAATVLAGIEATNLTDPEQTNLINVSGRDGSFVITGNNFVDGQAVSMLSESGFAKGSTYRITLTDARLRFEGEMDCVRDYNFTTAMEEVLNLELQQDIIYLSVDTLENITNDGEEVETLNIALYTAERDGSVSPTELTVGTFEYNGDLEIGQVVAVYEGLRPDLRTFETPEDECGDVGYVEITEKNGKVYTYKNAEAEDIIFEPDMLPLSIEADLDGDNENNSVTVENKNFDYSADVYANIELDSQTTVDPGDFLMFYSGIFGIETGDDAAEMLGLFGRITKVTDNGDGTTTVTYTDATWEEVQAVMDVYTNQSVSGEEMLEGVDTEKMEAEIEQQAMDSGFAQEAAQYLASLALATDNFTELSDNMNLEDYKVTLSDGTPISPEELQLMDNSIKVECELDDGYPKAKISIRPEHIGEVEGTDADKQGLAIELEVAATITISKSGSDNTIEINVSGKFVEEVGVDLGFKSKTIWKVWGIFPYIADYRATANFDLLNYTGIEVNATMVTKEADSDDDDEEDGDEEEGEDIAELIKDLLDKAKEEGEDEEEDEEESGNKLVQRYSEMIKQDSDYIKIVDFTIFEQEQQLPPSLPILAVNYAVDFIVEMDACVSIGFDFEYMTGKRYTYSVGVFSHGVTCDTVTLQEETYEFCFYAMGRLAVRAGIELEFNVGLFTTKLDSVGITAGAGAYTKLWGYFYYELKYAASTGRDQSYSGALLIEVGAFLEVGLNAKLLDGVLSAELEVLDKEWPLWKVGNQRNVLDFTTKQEDMPNVKLKQYIRSTVFPDSIFNLTYLDLKDGKEKTAIYNDYFDATKAESDKNRKNFTITMTNDKFSYDPQTNTLSVHPTDGDKKLEGEMIITWVHYPLSFSSKPIQRTIPLYWDNLRDGYVIVPYTNGGTYIPIIEAKYESKVTPPANPEKLGYNFEGWYSDEEFTASYTFPEQMPAQDANIYAKWSECTDTPYTVEHYQEQLLSGEYELFETEEFTGTTNAYVTPDVKNYVGFKAPAKQEVKILPDGSAVLRYYYDLQWHQVAFNPGEAGGEEVVYDLKFGGKVIAPIMAAEGYTFVGWDQEVADTMGTEDVTYTALWEKNPDTAYRVEYYLQQADGSYALQHMYEANGFTGDIIAVDTLRNAIVDAENNLTADQKYILEGAYAFDNMTVKGVGLENATIDGSGNTVIKINYKRVLYKVTYDFGYDNKEVAFDVCYGGAIPVQEGTRTGYKFRGWSVDGETIVTPAATMDKTSLHYVALWAPNVYAVTFDKNNDAATGSMNRMNFSYDVEKELTKNAFVVPYYSFAGWATQKGGCVVYGDGESVKNLTDNYGETVTLYAVWKPVEYTITYNGCEAAANANPAAYTVESETITLSAPVKAGYVFGGWYDNAEFAGTAVTTIAKGSTGNITLYAKWTAESATYKVEHYKEALDGSFTLAETENLTATAGAVVTPQVKAYTGFTAPVAQSVSVEADGTTVVRYEYTRNTYTITLNAGEGTLPDGVSVTITAKYEASIILPVPVRTGYGFNGWYNGATAFEASVMPAQNLTLTASYVEGQYNYTVNHYQQNVDGNGYTLFASVVKTAAIDTQVEAALNSYEGFSASTVAQTITISADESKNVVDYYYTRNKYTLSWNLDGGTASGYTQGDVYYGATVIAPQPVKTGYSYTWDQTPVTVMPAENISYTASWTANTYAVMFNANGGAVADGSIETRNVAFNASYSELATLTKAGYTFDGWFTAAEGGSKVTAETAMTVAQDHTLYAQFTAVTYAISYNGIQGATHTNPKSYGVATGAVTLTEAVKAGYTFAGWYENAEFSGSAVTVIPTDSAKDIVLYAKWVENSYTVIFHANNGDNATSKQQFTYTESKALDANTFTKAGYEFKGWSVDNTATKPSYTNEQVVSGLTGSANGEVHLYAVWGLVEYAILYENMDGAANAEDNPTSFTEKANVITLHDPEGKTGYTFGGWYMDAGLTDKVTGSLTLTSYRTWTFYAKWTANLYTITFDSCLGDTVPTETMLMTYDQAANLTLLSEMSAFTKYGYTFKGWSTAKDGGVVYTDGQNVTNLAASGNITLYAVWELNEYTISYDLSPFAEMTHENPVSYSFEDDDILLVAPSIPASRYSFLGWYEGDTLVTEIVKGEQRDIELKAKWADAGEFSVVLNADSTQKDYGSERSFTVIRTITEGTVPSNNPVSVYYRTLNGTAYGTTVDCNAETDKYHFKHVGGEDAYLTFGPEDTEMTFTVQDWGHDALADAAATVVGISPYERTFYVELYKAIDTVGTTAPQVKAEKVKVIPGGFAALMPGDMFAWKSKLVTSSTVTVTDSGYGSNTDYTVTPADIVGQSWSSDVYQNYAKQTASNYGFYVSFDVREDNDGYQWTKFNYTDGTLLAEYHFATKDDEPATSWGRNMKLPSKGADQGDIQFDIGGDCKVDNRWAIITDDGTTPYARTILNKSIKIDFDASGNGDDDWQYRNLYAYAKVIDERAPKQVGVAPLAFGWYTKGQEIYITVHYDEMLRDVSEGVTLAAIEGVPVENVEHVTGDLQTNVLVFKATVAEDFEVTPDSNTALVAQQPVIGKVADCMGNWSE